MLKRRTHRNAFGISLVMAVLFKQDQVATCFGLWHKYQSVAIVPCLKNVITYFCSVSVKYKPISMTIGRHVLEETLNKSMQKYVLALFREI